MRGTICSCPEGLANGVVGRIRGEGGVVVAVSGRGVVGGAKFVVEA